MPAPGSHHTTSCVIVACGFLLALATAAGGGEPAKEKPIDTRTALQQVLALAKRIVSNTSEYYVVRRDAAMAINRVHQTLGDWGKDGQLAWYARCVEAEPNDYVQEELFSGAMAAARGNKLHLGDLRAFWKQMDADFNERDRKLKYRAQRMHDRLVKYVQELPQHRPNLSRLRPIHIKPPDLRPLKKLRLLRQK